MINTYIATSSIDIVSILFLSGLIYNNNILADKRKKPFLYAIVLTITIILAEVGTVLSEDGGVGLRNLNIICNVFGFMLTPFIPMILITIFDGGILRKNLSLLIPTMLNIAAAVLSPLFGLLFYVDSGNHYERGSAFFLFVAVYIVNILLLVVITLRTGHKLLYPIKGKLFLLSVFIVAGTCVQLLVPSVYSSWHCVTLALFLFYILMSEFDGSFDTLTGLYNRAAFEKALKQESVRKSSSIIVMDINDFKIINDTYGHEYGDTVLKKVAAIIRDSFDDRCSCYRLGGDEFYVICKSNDHEKIERHLKTMTDNLAKERIIDSCLPTVAYGHSIFQRGDSENIQKTLKAADDQMYYFKQLQKSREHRGDAPPEK